MQIDCIQCYGKAIVHSRKKLDTKVSQLYCSCKNPECGHTFVMDLTFSHTLSPSASQSKYMIMDLFRSLPEEDRRALIANG
jgi:Ogr/Delta-like zinc finger